MHCYQIILGLVATVSAIDGYFHLGDNCDGPWVRCTNMNPGFCCGGGGTIGNSVGYRGIPTDWVIRGRGYNGNGCGVEIRSGVARNTNFLCLPGGNGDYTGTRYEFTSKKRSEATEVGVHKADLLGLGDGTTFNIADLDDDALNTLV